MTLPVFLLVCAFTRDLKVPDVSGPYCMVVQFGSGGAVTLSSKPVRIMGNVFRCTTVYVLFVMNSDQHDLNIV